MNELLPIIQQLADARNHQERAAWLRSCPIIEMRRHDSTIRNRLQLAGFHAGVSYVDELFVLMCATRDPMTGEFKPATQEAIRVLGEAVDIIAIRLDREAAQRAMPVETASTDL